MQYSCKQVKGGKKKDTYCHHQLKGVLVHPHGWLVLLHHIWNCSNTNNLRSRFEKTVRNGLVRHHKSCKTNAIIIALWLHLILQQKTECVINCRCLFEEYLNPMRVCMHCEAYNMDQKGWSESATGMPLTKEFTIGCTTDNNKQHHCKLL